MRRSLLLLCLLAAPARADDWPQWFGPNRDGIWRESGILDKFPPGGPKELWRTPIGAGYAGPAVTRGRVYITDYVLDKGAEGGFAKKRREGTERVLCLDEKTGQILWKHEYPVTYDIAYAAGPRTTPTVSGDKVYTLGAVGHLVCCNADKGNVIWKKNLREEYKTPSPPVMQWGFAGHPLVDGPRLICLVGGKGSVCVAFDRDTGKELWKNLNSEDPGYSPPMLHDVGGQKVLFLWTPTAVNALDPQTGELFWSYPFGGKGKKGEIKAGLTAPTLRVNEGYLLVTAFYDGPLLLKLNGLKQPTEAWRGHGRGEQPDQTDILHSIIATPVIQDGTIYGVDSYGELRGIDLKSGKRLWETHAATGGESLRWANAFLVPHQDRFFLFNELGELIIARLSPKGYDEVSRAKLLEPTNTMAGPKGRKVLWSHPAFADRSIFARNDREIVRYSLAKE